MLNPTQRTYGDLSAAYAFFNARLFEGRLPGCLVTLQRRSGTYGYFAGNRFGSADGQEITDEIALNPSHFATRSSEAVLSTLVHEMVHLWQHHFGKPSRAAYHNRQWAEWMRAVGLIPSHTGAPGGRETGQGVSHYVEPGGAFTRACAELLGEGFVVAYVERQGERETVRARRKAASKTRFTCPCCGAHAWGKPELRLICGECEEPMRAAGAEAIGADA